MSSMTRSRFSLFSDAKGVNDAIPAKAAQVDVKDAQCAARAQAITSASSNAGGGYSAPARRGGNSHRAPSHNGGLPFGLALQTALQVLLIGKTI